VREDVYFSVIVPAYNEAERLPRTLERFNKYLSSTGFTYAGQDGWVISLYSFSPFLVFGIPNADSRPFAEVAVRIFSHTKIEGWGFDIEVLAPGSCLQL
jgi:hypothetical protein